MATVALAERGCRVVAVELGAALAAVARRNLASFPAVEVVTAAFEDWPLPDEPFDLVLAATAFHWIDPGVRVVKVADALRPGGVLATVTTHHIAGGDEPFFAQAQACYERWDPGTPPGGAPLRPATDIRSSSDELDRSHRFDPAAQSGLLDCIARLIDTGYGGRITKRYLTELRVAPTIGP